MKDNKCSDCTNDKGCINCENGNMKVKKKEPEGVLKELLDNIDPTEYEKIRREMLKEAACEDLEKAVQAYSNLYNDECFDAIGNECSHIKNAFKAGANWLKVNLWKPADGTDLPIIDREVIVLTQTERQYPKVAIAHTMPMGDWKQFDGNRYYIERNGEVGWSLPDVKIWLDCDISKIIG